MLVSVATELAVWRKGKDKVSLRKGQIGLKKKRGGQFEEEEMKL